MKNFRVVNFRVEAKGTEGEHSFSEARMKVLVEGELSHVVGEGNGLVNALDVALRKALLPKFPFLEEVLLDNYEVHISNGRKNSEASVRVVIAFSREGKKWLTESVSSDIIHASLTSLAKGLDYAIEQS